MGERGWYSRGYLPHFDAPGLVQFITFNLADALPKRAIEHIRAKLEELPEDKRAAERRRRLERWLDAGNGACHLRCPEVAQIVEDRLLESDGDDCMLLAWCVMPNHVHIVCELADQVELWRLVKRWKGSTATYANRTLGKTGAFWYREYYDRYIRDTEHLRTTLRYVEENPVKAGLCGLATDWRWSSARLRAE